MAPYGAGSLSLTAADDTGVPARRHHGDGRSGHRWSAHRWQIPPRITPAVTRPVPLPNDASILPSLEVSIRHDGGDAETGFGLELGTSIVWHDPERGISAELRGRSLPIQLGTTIPLPSQAVGITSSGGMDALLQPTVMEGVDASPASNGQHFEAQPALWLPRCQ